MSSPKFDLIVRRLGVTLALAIVLACIISLFSEDAAWALFLPSWVALMVGWPYVSRRLRFDFPKPPAPRDPRRPRSAGAKRLVTTAVLAFVFSFALAWMFNADISMISLIPAWIALFYGWPHLSRRLTFLDFEKAPASPAPMRPLWLRLIRNTIAVMGAIVLAVVGLCSTAILYVVLSHHRAQKVHDSIHVGMTVQEVLETAKDCDIFQAGSDFPYDEKADGDNIPAMQLRWTKDGTYRTYDLATRQTLQLSESEAIERLHAKLHDGYKWHFHYTYLNLTPQRGSFSVVFGPDGRVAEVKPVCSRD
jgi:hypothetical protein